jgi:hypothetical protein
VVASEESEGACIGEGPMVGDVIYLVNGTRVQNVDSLCSTLDNLKTAGAIVLQVERQGGLRYVVIENDK